MYRKSLYFIFSIVSFVFLLFGTAHSSPEIYKVQVQLRELGYNTGPIDGKWGAKTKSAIIKFQIDNRLPVSGELTSVTKDALNNLTAKQTEVDQIIDDIFQDFKNRKASDLNISCSSAYGKLSENQLKGMLGFNCPNPSNCSINFVRVGSNHIAALTMLSMYDVGSKKSAESSCKSKLSHIRENKLKLMKFEQTLSFVCSNSISSLQWGIVVTYSENEMQKVQCRDVYIVNLPDIKDRVTGKLSTDEFWEKVERQRL